MKKLIGLILCLALVSLVVGCAKETGIKESIPSIVSEDIQGVMDLDEALDVSDLDALDADLADALEGLDI